LRFFAAGVLPGVPTCLLPFLPLSPFSFFFFFTSVCGTCAEVSSKDLDFLGGTEKEPNVLGHFDTYPTQHVHPHMSDRSWAKVVIWTVLVV